MKLALVCFSVLLLASVHAGLVALNDINVIHSKSAKSVRDGPLHISASVIHGRQRTLFARRGMYERQRVQQLRPKVAVAPVYSRPKAEINLASPRCSVVSESCVPHSHCCDPCASCRCRFFNAVCFCRKANGRCGRS